MCLVLVGWRAHPEYRLVVAANRDEFYPRPTEAMRRRPEVPGLLAGADAGAPVRPGDPPGTWLGLHEGSGRFAAITNVRNPADDRPDARSRGRLLTDFLSGRAADRPATPAGAERYLQRLATAPDAYNGYNVFVADPEALWWHSNRAGTGPRPLPPGFHGLSNSAFVTSTRPEPGAPFEAPAAVWPKVRAGLDGLRAVVATDIADTERYFEVLADRTRPPEDMTPRTGIPWEMERELSSIFIANTVHGTRASTVALIREDGGYEITERSFGPLGEPRGEVSFSGRIGTDRLDAAS